jgi:hypothetical protein
MIRIEGQGFYSLIEKKTADFIGRSNWLFPKIKDWLSDPQGSRYFLITGKAGTGKSAIAARLWKISEGKINDYYIQEGFLSAIHVCSARENKSTDPDLFPKSLAKQLILKKDIDFTNELIKSSENNSTKKTDLSAEIKDSIADKIIGIYIENLKIGVSSPNMLFNRLFREPLETISQKNPNKKIVVLIDSLDESITKFDSNSIVSLITNMDTLSKNIRFILTTRDYEDIIELFLNDSEIISLSDQYFENNKNDIHEYINLRMNKDLILRNHYECFIDDLSLKAEGNFLYVTFLLDAIVEGKMELTKENLDKVPPFLDGLYYEFLNRIKSKNTRRWEKELKPILDVLSVSFTGFNESELTFLCELSPTKVSDCLSELTPFIKPLHSVSDSNSNRSKLYHQSLIDFFRKQKYLTKNKKGQEYTQKNNFFILEEEANRRIVRKYYDDEKNNLLLDYLDGYSTRHLGDHLFSLIGFRDYEHIDWYQRLLLLAKNKEFEEKQLEFFPSETDLPLKTIRRAYEASLEKYDPVSTVEMLLLHVTKFKEILLESPLSVLRTISIDNNDILEKAWRIADLYDNQTRLKWYLLIAWCLDWKKNITDAEKTLNRLFEKVPVTIIDGIYRGKSNYANIVRFCARCLYEGYKDNIVKIFKYLSNHDIYEISRYFIKNNNLKIGLEVYNYVGGYKRSEALCSIAQSLAQSNRLDEAIKAAKEIEDYRYRSEALCSIAQSLAQSNRLDESAKVFDESIKAAKEIGSPNKRSESLSHIAESLARSNKPDEVIKAAKEIEEDNKRLGAFSYIAQSLARSNTISPLNTQELWNYIMKQYIDYPEMAYLVCSLFAEYHPNFSKEIADLMLKYHF